MAENDDAIGGSVFWIIIWLTTLAGIIWLAIWSSVNQSIEALVIAVVFGLMLLSAPALSGRRIFNQGTWSETSLSFTIGFWAYFLAIKFFGASLKSVLVVTKPALLGTTLATLPRFMSFIIEKLVIPISEESFFLITIPLGLVAIMDLLARSDKLSFFENEFLQTGLVAGIGGIAFALFHVGKIFTAFVVSAILFRAISVIFSKEEDLGDLIPFTKLVSALGVGMHIANNWAFDTGFIEGLQLLATEPVGWFVIIFMGVIFASAGNQIGISIKNTLT